MIPYTIRPHRAVQDAEAVYALWEATLGDTWKTTPEAFQDVLCGDEKYESEHSLVAERGGRMLGLVATQMKPGATDAIRRGSIPLIMVAPEARRQGIGTALLDKGLEHLRENSVSQVQLGAGGHSYFWPGVPERQTEAVAFFEARGWAFSETSYDLLRDLQDYETPPELIPRVTEQGIVLRQPKPEESNAVLAFESQYFPEWSPYFLVALISEGDLTNVLVAWDREGKIIGTLLMFTSDSGNSQAKLWKPLLGDDMGGFGAVGVTEAWRERGIGTALSARASEILKERGVRNSHIGWTWLLDFYGRLGYKPWRSFLMTWRDL